jgi:hypothetical protein
MKKIIAFIFILSVALTTMSLHPADTSDVDCNILHKGTFVYADEQNQPVKVVINGKNHTEYHNNGKYYIKSEIKWNNDCEYTAKLVKITLPGFPYKRGTTWKVSVDDIVDNAVFCSGIIDGKSFTSKLIKMNK